MIRYFCSIFRSISPAVALVDHEEDREKSYHLKMLLLFFNEPILLTLSKSRTRREKYIELMKNKKIIALRDNTLLTNL